MKKILGYSKQFHLDNRYRLLHQGHYRFLLDMISKMKILRLEHIPLDYRLYKKFVLMKKQKILLRN
jgi:hypothetical protein